MEKDSKFKLHYERFDKSKRVVFEGNEGKRQMKAYISEYYIKEYKDTFDIYFVVSTPPEGPKYYFKAVRFKNLKQYDLIETVKKNLKNEFGIFSIYHCDMNGMNTPIVHEWKEFNEDFFHDG